MVSEDVIRVKIVKFFREMYMVLVIVIWVYDIWGCMYVIFDCWILVSKIEVKRLLCVLF